METLSNYILINKFLRNFKKQTNNTFLLVFNKRKINTRTLFFIMLMQFLILNTANAQIKISYSGKVRDTLKIDKYLINEKKDECFKLRMNPGDYRILNENTILENKDKTVTQVDLVYTAYPIEDDFKELNRKRMLELYIHYPEVFKERAIEWRIVEQTGVKSNTGLSSYFHGFVVHYRKDLELNSEKRFLSDVIHSKAVPTDSTISKIFDRNKNIKNMPVVIDVTGSMSPYTAQLFYWLKTNTENKRFKEFVFFNDDDMQDIKQQKGIDTIGLKGIKSQSLDSVLQCCFKAMANQGQIENNLKALFYTQKCFSKSSKTGVVMIADNWQTPEDLFALNDFAALKIPVYIIVCGAEETMNPSYLEMAYATGGSVHTMEEDILYLKNLKDGEKVSFKKKNYQLRGGKFLLQ